MVTQIDPFRTIAISRAAHALEVAGKSVIHMEFGQPSTGAPAGAIARARQVLATDPMGYWESPDLKRRICRLYHERHAIEIAPEQVSLTCGASPALVLALLSSFGPGDQVALARPGYVAYRNTLKALHMHPLEIDCDAGSRFQLSAALIDALDPAPAGIIISSPANPTGSIIAPDALKALIEACLRRGIKVISDEIYHGLSYDMATISALEHDPNAVIINSFSKYYSMSGWRLGWIVSPRGTRPSVSDYMGNLFLTPPSLSQHAALVAMDETAELDAHVETYRTNRALMLAALPSLGLGQIAPPDGAFYIYADVSRFTDDSLAFCHELLRDTGVATASGVDFDPVNGHRFVRFSFAVSTDRVEAALERMVPWFAARAK